MTWACASTGQGNNTKVAQNLPTPSAMSVSPVLGPQGPETARYTIRHAIVGELGQVALRLTPIAPQQNQPQWQGEGSASGSFLGIGESSTFVSQFNSITGLSTKWTIKRDIGSAVISDDCEQTEPGIVATHRIHSKKPENWQTLNAGAETTDPFGLLLRLRISPPTSTATVMVLDGRALWKVTVQPPKAETITVAGQQTAALRFDLRSDPLDWQREPSKTRTTQHLTVWLANTPIRTPLALQAESPLGDVKIEVDIQDVSKANRFWPVPDRPTSQLLSISDKDRWLEQKSIPLKQP